MSLLLGGGQSGRSSARHPYELYAAHFSTRQSRIPSVLLSPTESATAARFIRRKTRDGGQPRPRLLTLISCFKRSQMSTTKNSEPTSSFGVVARRAPAFPDPSFNFNSSAASIKPWKIHPTIALPYLGPIYATIEIGPRSSKRSRE